MPALKSPKTTSTKISFAYCKQMGRVVDVFWAQNCFFRQSEPRRKLTFLCPFRLCGQVHGTRVSGVNYWKLADERKKRPHYKHLDTHVPECPLSNQQILKPKTEEQPSGALREENRKGSRFVDVFCLDDWDRDGLADQMSQRGFWEFSGARDEFTQGRAQPRPGVGLNESAILEELVSSYLSLTPSQRRKKTLTFKDFDSVWTTTYAEAFRRLDRYDESCRAVYWSYATITRQANGFLIRSLNQVKCPGVEGELRPEFPIDDSQLGRDGLGTRLRDMLLYFSGRTDLDILMLFWGRLHLTTKSTLEPQIRHFGHLAFRAREKEEDKRAAQSDLDPQDLHNGYQPADLVATDPAHTAQQPSTVEFGQDLKAAESPEVAGYLSPGKDRRNTLNSSREPAISATFNVTRSKSNITRSKRNGWLRRLLSLFNLRRR